MSVPQNVNVITLGVADLNRSRRFYVDGLGWPVAVEMEEIVFLQAGHGMLLGLFGAASLAQDAGAPGAEESPAGGRQSLAHNLSSPEAVDAFYGTAIDAGATVLKQPEAVFWGGYSGYFADPDGFWWEVAHNPMWLVADDGTVGMSGGS